MFAAISTLLITEDRPTGIAPSLVTKWSSDIEESGVLVTNGVIDVRHVFVPIGDCFAAVG